MAGNVSNLVAGRDYILYMVDWNSTITLPADSVDYGTAWGTPAGQTGAWVDIGYTDGGIQFTTSVDRNEIRVDQQLDPVFRLATGRDTRVTTNVAEVTPANIKRVTGQGSTTTVAAGSGTRGHVDWDQTATITDLYQSVGCDIRQPGTTEAYRLALWKTLQLGSPQMTFSAEDKAMVSMEMAALPDDSTSPSRIVKFRKMVAALP